MTCTIEPIICFRFDQVEELTTLERDLSVTDGMAVVQTLTDWVKALPFDVRG